MAVSEQTRFATVEEHVRRENARDMDVVMRLSATATRLASCTMASLPRATPRFRRSYEIRLDALPDFRFEVKQRHFTADSLIAEHVLRFTNKNGLPVEVPMCIVYCFDEAGKLSEERVYIDEARMMP